MFGEDCYGHLVVRTPKVPAALVLLLSISAPLLAWRRLESNRSEQNRALALQISRLSTLFDLTRTLGEGETAQDLLRLMGDTLAGEFNIQRLLVVDPSGRVTSQPRAWGRCRPPSPATPCAPWWRTTRWCTPRSCATWTTATASSTRPTPGDGHPAARTTNCSSRPC